MANDPRLQELEYTKRALLAEIEKQELWLAPQYRELERLRGLVRSGEAYLKNLEDRCKEIDVEIHTIKASSALATGTPPGEQTGHFRG